MEELPENYCNITERTIHAHCEYIDKGYCSKKKDKCSIKLNNNGLMYAIPTRALELEDEAYELS
jgi:hypothetical protein